MLSASASLSDSLDLDALSPGAWKQQQQQQPQQQQPGGWQATMRAAHTKAQLAPPAGGAIPARGAAAAPAGWQEDSLELDSLDALDPYEPAAARASATPPRSSTPAKQPHRAQQSPTASPIRATPLPSYAAIAAPTAVLGAAAAPPAPPHAAGVGGGRGQGSGAPAQPTSPDASSRPGTSRGPANRGYAVIAQVRGAPPPQRQQQQQQQQQQLLQRQRSGNSDFSLDLDDLEKLALPG